MRTIFKLVGSPEELWLKDQFIKEAEPFFETNKQAEITQLVSTIRRLEISATVFVQVEEDGI